MKVDIQLPESIGRQLEHEWHDVPRRALEAIAIEAYRSDALSREQVGDMLGLSLWETETFLKQHQVYLAYDVADLEEDRATLKRILPQ
jgi:predicted HTH domain antitoxin